MYSFVAMPPITVIPYLVITTLFKDMLALSRHLISSREEEFKLNADIVFK